MPYEITKIPKEYTYINQIPEFKEDLPDNIYLDKTSTGCGATYAVLTNNVDYIITVPFISLGENKVDQSESNVGTDVGQYPHKLFMVSGKTLDTEIRGYLRESSGTVRKILVTYDSLPRLMTFINPKEFKLFIDEAHKLIEYAGNFKPKVIYDLLESIDSFKSYLLCTATPTREKYLPERVKPMRKVKLDWEAGHPVKFNHINLKQNQLRSSILSLCLNYIRGSEEGNAYFFYNSVLSIAKIVKDLVSIFKCSPDDINIICANTEQNVKILKRIDKKFYPRKAIEKDENGVAKPNIKKINFITSTSFEGQDFWDSYGRTYIVSDGKLDHTKLDISTQVSQIVGRLRDSKYKDNVTLIWTISPTLGFNTLEEYSQSLEVQKEDSLICISDFDSVKSLNSKKALQERFKTNPFIIDVSEGEELKLIPNPDATNHLLNTYEGTLQQYYVNINQFLENVNSVQEHVQYTLKDVFSGEVVSNYDIPILNSTDKMKLGYKGSFTDIASKYVQALITINNKGMYSQEMLDASEEFKTLIEGDSRFEILVEYIKLFGADQELVESCASTKTEYYLTKKIEKYKEKEYLSLLLKTYFSLDTTYTNQEVKDILERLYKIHNLTGKPKLTDLELTFKVQRTNISREGKISKAVKLFPM